MPSHSRKTPSGALKKSKGWGGATQASEQLHGHNGYLGEQTAARQVLCGRPLPPFQHSAYGVAGHLLETSHCNPRFSDLGSVPLCDIVKGRLRVTKFNTQGLLETILTANCDEHPSGVVSSCRLWQHLSAVQFKIPPPFFSQWFFEILLSRQIRGNPGVSE